MTAPSTLGQNPCPRTTVGGRFVEAAWTVTHLLVDLASRLVVRVALRKLRRRHGSQPLELPRPLTDVPGGKACAGLHRRDVAEEGGLVVHELVRNVSGLEDCLVEESFGRWADAHVGDGVAAGRDAEDGHAARVAAERRDVAMDPFEPRHLAAHHGGQQALRRGPAQGVRGVYSLVP